MAIQEANEEAEETNTKMDEDNNQNTSDEDNNLTESEDDKKYEDDDNENDCQGFTFLHNNVICSTEHKAGIPKNWILLDSQSTIDVFSIAALLTNI